MSVPDKGTVFLSSPPKSLPTTRSKGWRSFWLQERDEEAYLRPAGLKSRLDSKESISLSLGVGSGVADSLGQPGACCPGNSPAPPLLIGCHGGSQPRFKGTPVIALLKIYQSHCGWRNKRSFSSSAGSFPVKKGEWVALSEGLWSIRRGSLQQNVDPGPLPHQHWAAGGGGSPHFSCPGSGRGCDGGRGRPSQC